MTTHGAENLGHSSSGGRRSHESLDEQVRRRGLRPIASGEDLARDDVFESDAEVDAFIAHVYAERHSNLI
jgi:hypothetical protein